uniref:50S ribosomal protein L35 n=1 Tax=Kalanchoe fedtschenkoi TaxID=63787 RepID=A0A7N0U4Y9_KALFE
MQRLCSKFRSMAVAHAHFQTRRFIHHSPPLPSPILNNPTRSLLYPPPLTSRPSAFVAQSPLLPFSFVQVRHLTPKDRKKRKMLTPTVSKLKKYKLKFYSSYKGRFRPLNDGTIRRWKEGKRHNAHLKSKKSKRRLRQPALVPPAYATVMKKLGFCT